MDAERGERDAIPLSSLGVRQARVSGHAAPARPHILYDGAVASAETMNEMYIPLGPCPGTPQ